MFIQTEATPNPETVKFIPDCPVMETGVAEFTTTDEAARSPLATRLFDIAGVKGVFFGRDFVSVTKTESIAWQDINPQILALVMEHFSLNQPLFHEGQESAQDHENDLDDELTKQIKELLDTRVRPMVAMDGGDIVFHSFDQGIVYLTLRGACSGCPSSTATLKMGIENMLRHYVPEVLEVRPVVG